VFQFNVARKSSFFVASRDCVILGRSVLPNKVLSNKKRILNKNTNKILFFISNKFLSNLFLFFILE
jgi:hypothetical protein